MKVLLTAAFILTSLSAFAFNPCESELKELESISEKQIQSYDSITNWLETEVSAKLRSLGYGMKSAADAAIARGGTVDKYAVRDAADFLINSSNSTDSVIYRMYDRKTSFESEMEKAIHALQKCINK